MSGADGSNGMWRCMAASGSSQTGRPDGDADRRGDALRADVDDDAKRGGPDRKVLCGEPLGVRLFLTCSGESLRSNSTTSTSSGPYAIAIMLGVGLLKQGGLRLGFCWCCSLRTAPNCCCLCACSSAPAVNALFASFCPAALRGSNCCATMIKLELLTAAASAATNSPTPMSDGVCDDAREAGIVGVNNTARK